MAELVCTGIVVRSMEYRDRDRIVSLLTSELGRIDAIARGAKVSYKRFGGHLEPFNLVEAVLTHRAGGLSLLRSASAHRSWPHLRGDLSGLALASYAAELALGVAQQGHADPALCSWLEDGLAAAEVCAAAPLPNRRWSHLAERAERTFLGIQGWMPDLRQCTHCAAELSPAAPTWLVLPDLTPLCSRCRSLDVRALVLPAEAEPPIAGEPPERLAACRRAWAIAIRHHLGRVPKSAGFFDSTIGVGAAEALP